MSQLELSKLHFLLIDDFANYRAMLRSILQSCGAQYIDDVSNAEDALEKVVTVKYDVILCDYNLGDGKNGQQLLEEIMFRQLIPYGTIYIMVTAENTQNMVMAAIEYKPDGYLSKPFPKELLLKRLELLLKKKTVMKDIYRAYNRKNYTKALAIADKKMAEHGKYTLEIGKLKGEIALLANELDIAEQVYDQALAVRDFQWAKVGKAKVLMQREDYEDAQDLLEDVIDENKHYIEAYDLLANIFEIQGKTEQVQTVLSTATQISPNTVARQQHLAAIATQNHDYTLAEKSLKMAINQGKHSCFGKIGDNLQLVKIYAEAGKPKMVTQALTAARTTYKKDKESILHTQFVESMAQKKLGNDDRSRQLFQEAMGNLPGDLSKLPKEFQDDLITTATDLGETELAKALTEDINNVLDNSNFKENSKKYHYLLLNGKGIRLYEAHRIHDSIRFFVDAAINLSDNISLNMNAAQALLFEFKAVHKAKKSANLLIRARNYLDISKQLDSSNEKYNKLEKIYSTLIKV